MLQAIFYARFHPERGPSIISQYPATALLPLSAESLLQFSDISAYVIAPYEFCNQPLSICSNGYRVLGYPVSLENSKYDRNRFTFNVCFVLDEEDDVEPWSSIVRKTATFFAVIEEQDGLLQKEEDLPGLKLAGEEGFEDNDVGIVYTILETIKEELNSFGETCVRVDSVHTLSLKFSIAKSPPPMAHAWQVPLLVRSLPKPDQWSWDLTLRRIYPHINGINHIHRIATLADVELKLVKRAVGELVFHERATLLDIFHFQAIYTTTAAVELFFRDGELQDECIMYTSMDPARNPFAECTSAPPPTRETIISLYTSLIPGQTLHDYLLSNQSALSTIDIRRFITYGVIKGFLRRIQKYALATVDQPHKSHQSFNTPTTEPPPASLRNGRSSPSVHFSPSPTKHRRSTPIRDEEAIARELDRAWKKAALSSGWATPPDHQNPVLGRMLKHGEGQSLGRSAISAEESRWEEDEKLRPFLDGHCCFDQIGVELGLSEKKIIERLKSGRFGEVVMFCR